MVERTNDINKILVTGNYYTKDYDLSFIKHVVDCLNEGRDKGIHYSFNFTIEDNMIVTFINNPETKTKTTICDTPKSTLTIINHQAHLKYTRLEKRENKTYEFDLTFADDEDNTFIMETSSRKESGIVLRKKRKSVN